MHLLLQSRQGLFLILIHTNASKTGIFILLWLILLLGGVTLPLLFDCFLRVFRILAVQIRERHKLAWLGVESDPQLQSDYLVKAYKRYSDDAAYRPPWFLSKDKINYGLGLLGIKKGYGESEATSPRARRKRVSKKKA